MPALRSLASAMHVTACKTGYVALGTTVCCVAGANHEFVWVGRLDNLAMSYCATAALAAAFPDEASLAGHDAVKAVALFDHEEVGSSSAQGESWDESLSCSSAGRAGCAGRLWHFEPEGQAIVKLTVYQ